MVVGCVEAIRVALEDINALRRYQRRRHGVPVGIARGLDKTPLPADNTYARCEAGDFSSHRILRLTPSPAVGHACQ